MSKFVFSSFDDYDSRREIWRQLHSLSPADRIVVLRHFCDMVWDRVGGAGVKPRGVMADSAVKAYRSDAWDVRLTNEVYADLWILVSQYGLDANRMAVTLEGWARRPWEIPPVRRRAAPIAVTGPLPAASSCRLLPS